MREVVVGMERLKILHIGCCRSLAAYFFFSKSNGKTTSNVGDICSASITGFDDEPELLLMFCYEKWLLDFQRQPTNIMVAKIEKQKTTMQDMKNH
jgi:hypothetical protein